MTSSGLTLDLVVSRSLEVPVMYLKWRNGAKYRIRWESARSIQNGKPRSPFF
jgi:hypothetical protein